MKTPPVSLLVSLLLLLFVKASAFAADPTTEFSEAQVDGIGSRVVDNLWSRTDYWWSQGDYPRIIAEDRIITEADPNFLQPYSTGAWLMESMGDNKDAEKYYRLGAIRNPDQSFIWYNLGFFYYNTVRNYPKAIEAFQIDVKTSGATINDWKMLAHSYERNHDLPKALEVWRLLSKQYPNDGVIALNLQKVQAIIASTQQTQPRHN